VARITGRDPDAVAPRDTPYEWEQILRQREDAGPAMRDLRQLAEKLDEERVERLLERLRRSSPRL
jgi:hypothetical protein